MPKSASKQAAKLAIVPKPAGDLVAAVEAFDEPGHDPVEPRESGPAPAPTSKPKGKRAVVTAEGLPEDCVHMSREGEPLAVVNLNSIEIMKANGWSLAKK